MTNDDRHIGHVAQLVQQCESYLDEQAPDRERALEYHDGKVDDLPVDTDDDGNPVRSSVVSKDVRSALKKLMPSIMRSILSNDKLVEYAPVAQEDEAGAEQATDYVNNVVVPECGAEQAIYDSVFDALLLKTGIVKWAAYRKLSAEIHEFTDQGDNDVLGLFDDPDIEIFDHEKTEETDKDVLALDPNARRHSFKLRRTVKKKEVRLEAIPRGSFLIFPGADSIDASPIVGERQEVTRSELVERGYDREKVDNLTAQGGVSSEDDDKHARMGDDWTQIEGGTTKALETVKIYEVYVRLDLDGDGIAEMHKIVFGEGGDGDKDEKNRVVLEKEAVTEAPYADVVAERDAHQFEGHSVFEDVEDIQRIKTSLLRGTLDNIYWQNNPQPEVDLSVVADPEAVFAPRFGKPILKKGGTAGVPAVTWRQIPFYADSSFQMLPYMDEIAKDRTGITEQSGGLDPAQIANVNTGVAQLAAEAGIAQAEMIIRTLSRGGLKKAFRGLLKLVIAHHDQPRTVRIRKEWVEYDPRHWNVDMDCKVNVGLGAGSRERDMAVLQVILGLQEKLLGQLGPDNPYVKPDQLYNTLAKMTETAGFPSAEPYFTKPDPEEIQQELEAQQNQPDPEKMKVQAQMQIEQAKADARQQVEQAQMQADLMVKDAERRKDLEVAELKAQVDLLKHNQQMALEYAKHGLAPPQMAQIGLPGAISG
ncbi:portal protein [Leisingera sp. NJS204]|uniref:portal protein n=1 Tax=Leisingera sp. NJS204 TaxID=2508307 RepID=UPI0010134829|nr:phage portal protein [Leisingera sp. NJS204]QAX31306.1 phage portal protein [Leisingera sp. NJS204]